MPAAAGPDQKQSVTAGDWEIQVPVINHVK